MHHNRYLLYVFLIVCLTYAKFTETFIVGDSVDVYQYTTGKKTYRAELPKNREANDYTPIGFTKQPSFIRGGGLLNKREQAFVLYIDGDVIPFTPMLGYCWGWFYWWDLGVDVGADAGIVQVLLHTRIENIKTRKSELFFWANAFKTGYKIHKFDYKPDLRFDDRSWLTVIENSLGLRLGKERRKVLYLNTIFYIDYDLHSPRRQTDYYITPAALGFETMVGEHGGFFAEVGCMYGITGMAFGDGSLLYKNDWFPVFKIGVALRSGKTTAVYYTRETKPLSRNRR